MIINLRAESYKTHLLYCCYNKTFKKLGYKNQKLFFYLRGNSSR